jgi:hypothetical protein
MAKLAQQFLALAGKTTDSDHLRKALHQMMRGTAGHHPSLMDKRRHLMDSLDRGPLGSFHQAIIRAAADFVLTHQQVSTTLPALQKYCFPRMDFRPHLMVIRPI